MGMKETFLAAVREGIGEDLAEANSYGLEVYAEIVEYYANAIPIDGVVDASKELEMHMRMGGKDSESTATIATTTWLTIYTEISLNLYERAKAYNSFTPETQAEIDRIVAANQRNRTEREE